jgi:hypothetical protein
MQGPGGPTPSGIPGFSSGFGIVARAGGGNANATQLNSWLNTVATVATAADSVMLPPGYAGEEVTVINHGANSCQVFGYMSTVSGDVVTDTIAPAASGTQGTAGVALAALAAGYFYCMVGQGGTTNAITPAQWQHKAIA